MTEQRATLRSLIIGALIGTALTGIGVSVNELVDIQERRSMALVELQTRNDSAAREQEVRDTLLTNAPTIIRGSLERTETIRHAVGIFGEGSPTGRIDTLQLRQDWRMNRLQPPRILGELAAYPIDRPGVPVGVRIHLDSLLTAENRIWDAVTIYLGDPAYAEGRGSTDVLYQVLGTSSLSYIRAVAGLRAALLSDLDMVRAGLTDLNRRAGQSEAEIYADERRMIMAKVYLGVLVPLLIVLCVIAFTDIRRAPVRLREVVAGVKARMSGPTE